MSVEINDSCSLEVFLRLGFCQVLGSKQQFQESSVMIMIRDLELHQP